MATKAELVAEAERLGLDSSGTAAEIQARIDAANEEAGGGEAADEEAPAEEDTDDRTGSERKYDESMPASPLPTVNVPRPVVDGVVQWEESELHPEIEQEEEEKEAEAAPAETGEAPAPSTEAPGTVSEQ